MTVSGKGNVAAWVLQVVAAAAFVAAGAAKLAGVPFMVDLFAQIGMGQWFRFVTVAVEVAGGLALLTPRTAPLGAIALICTMVGAVATHVVVLRNSPAAALVLLAVLAAVLWLRRDRLPGRLAAA